MNGQKKPPCPLPSVSLKGLHGNGARLFSEVLLPLKVQTTDETGLTVSPLLTNTL